jgi:hypothetical protein
MRSCIVALLAVATLATAAEADDLTPRPFLFQKTATVADALRALTEQTGNAVDDRRRAAADTPRSFDIQNLTFWPAFDRIATQAGGHVSLYQGDGRPALVDGAGPTLPVSYGGLFRTTVKRVSAVRDLEARAHFSVIQLEVTWEPRFHPYLLETGPRNLVLQDESGRPVTVPEPPRGQAPVSGRGAATLDLRLPGFPRSASKIGLIKGQLAAIGPERMLRFEFDQFGPARKEMQGGVTVEVREFRADDGLWTLGLALDYPAQGPRFESFQSWLGNNQVYLQKRDSRQRFPVNGGYESDEQGGRRAFLRYFFVEQRSKGLTLGRPADWKLVYETPANFVELPVPFEFRDLPLP